MHKKEAIEHGVCTQYRTLKVPNICPIYNTHNSQSTKWKHTHD